MKWWDFPIKVLLSCALCITRFVVVNTMQLKITGADWNNYGTATFWIA